MSSATPAEGASYLGSPLARGPMGGDQYTKIHNEVFRDPRLSGKAMGIFGMLSTHTEGWRLDEKAIARAMRDGRDAVRTGLHELEKYHYLVRARERRPDGRLGKVVWFFTDLPAQLRGLGITDEDLVATKVQEAFDAWQQRQTRNPRSEPETENPSVALTSGNSDVDRSPAPALDEAVDNSSESASLPSSPPTPGFPAPVNPALANPPHKKNKNQKTNRKKTNAGGPTPLQPPMPAADAAGTNSGGDVAKGVTTDGDQRKSALHARARELAGPVAVAAVTADPSITENELAMVISQASPQLTQGQCVGRAATLLAWEHTQHRHRGDVTSGGESSQAGTSPGGEPDLAGRLIS